MSGPEFRTLDGVEYGRVDRVSPLIRRVIAENPSKYTYHGTGTYLVGHGDVVVIDPGPDLGSHRDALAAALAGETVRAILVTHCHADHSPLARWLAAETGAPTFGGGPHPRPTAEEVADAWEPPDDGDEPAPGIAETESVDHGFRPDVTVADGDVAVDLPGVTMAAVLTPGHTSNHVCWTLAQESALFTGDHVMGWSTTVVAPPDGDMAAYMASLRRVADRGDATLWPTHGPPRDDGPRYVAALIEHREQRSAAIVDALRAGDRTCREIVERLYVDVRRELHPPARRSVWAHLVDLTERGVVGVDGPRPTLTSAYFAT